MGMQVGVEVFGEDFMWMMRQYEANRGTFRVKRVVILVKFNGNFEYSEDARKCCSRLHNVDWN